MNSEFGIAIACCTTRLALLDSEPNSALLVDRTYSSSQRRIDNTLDAFDSYRQNAIPLRLVDTGVAIRPLCFNAHHAVYPKPK